LFKVCGFLWRTAESCSPPDDYKAVNAEPPAAPFTMVYPKAKPLEMLGENFIGSVDGER
jgi:hypothetical protein